MSRERAAYLVAYDISSPRRWSRVYRRLCACALRVQYSVFVGAFTPDSLAALAAKLRGELHRYEDDLRIYRLPACCAPVVRGRPAWPRGLLLALADPAALAAFTDPHTPPAPPPVDLAIAAANDTMPSSCKRPNLAVWS